jgi:hypothetical protein
MTTKGTSRVRGARTRGGRGKRPEFTTEDVKIVVRDGKEGVAREGKAQDPPDLDLLERMRSAVKFPEVYDRPEGLPTVAWQSAVSDNPLGATIEKAGQTESLIVIPAGVYTESIKVEHSNHFVAKGKVELASNDHADSILVAAQNGVVTFEGFRITMLASQGWCPVVIDSGLAVFKNCTIESNKTISIRLRGTGRAVFIGCTVVAVATPALEVSAESAIFAQDCKFTSKDDSAVLVKGTATARFDGCSVESYGDSKSAFRFEESPVFLFENSRIFQPFQLGSDSDFAVVHHCDIDTLDLKVESSSRCLFHTCTFNAVALEVSGQSGVRVVNSQFLNGSPSPQLRVFEGASVAVNDCEFAGTNAPSAVFAYRTATLAISDSIFHDLAGTGIFAMGGANPSVNLKVEGCGFGRVGGSAIVAQDGPTVDISGTLFKFVRGCGAIFANAGPVTVTESQFSSCENSGLEVGQSDPAQGATIEGCVFEENKNAGVFATGGRLTIRKCDFTKNALAGLEVRGAAEFTVESVYFDSNAGGGLAVARCLKGTVDGAAVFGAQEFGIAVREQSDVKLSNLWVREGSSPGIYIGDGSKAELAKVTIDGTQGVALLVAQGGQATIVSLESVDINGANTGLQVLGGAKVAFTRGKFVKNGVHIDLAQTAELEASDVSFTQSRDGVGVIVEPGAKGSFTKCDFSSETKAGIAVGGVGKLTEATVEGCQLAGVYWYDQASGWIRGSTIRNNEQCGVVIMSGSAELEKNTIDGHTIFGVHVHTGLSSTVAIAADNVFSQNTMADTNYED